MKVSIIPCKGWIQLTLLVNTLLHIHVAYSTDDKVDCGIYHPYTTKVWLNRLLFTNYANGTTTEGSVAELRCKLGYYLHGPKYARCGSDRKWKIDDSDIRCDRIKCPRPHNEFEIDNGKVDSFINRSGKVNYLLNSNFWVICGDGYKPSSPPVRTCLRNGSKGVWSQPTDIYGEKLLSGGESAPKCIKEVSYIDIKKCNDTGVSELNYIHTKDCNGSSTVGQVAQDNCVSDSYLVVIPVLSIGTVGYIIGFIGTVCLICNHKVLGTLTKKGYRQCGYGFLCSLFHCVLPCMLYYRCERAGSNIGMETWTLIKKKGEHKELPATLKKLITKLQKLIEEPHVQNLETQPNDLKTLIGKEPIQAHETNILALVQHLENRVGDLSNQIRQLVARTTDDFERLQETNLTTLVQKLEERDGDLVKRIQTLITSNPEELQQDKTYLPLLVHKLEERDANLSSKILTMIPNYPEPSALSTDTNLSRQIDRLIERNMEISSLHVQVQQQIDNQELARQSPESQEQQMNNHGLLLPNRELQQQQISQVDLEEENVTLKKDLEKSNKTIKGLRKDIEQLKKVNQKLTHEVNTFSKNKLTVRARKNSLFEAHLHTIEIELDWIVDQLNNLDLNKYKLDPTIIKLLTVIPTKLDVILKYRRNNTELQNNLKFAKPKRGTNEPAQNVPNLRQTFQGAGAIGLESEEDSSEQDGSELDEDRDSTGRDSNLNEDRGSTGRDSNFNEDRDSTGRDSNFNEESQQDRLTQPATAN